MNRKVSCENTDYTNGFKIHRQKDGTFIAEKGEHRPEAKSAKEINEFIQKFRNHK